MTDGGKGGGYTGPTRYTGEVRHPLEELADRMYQLGADDATVQSGVDAHSRGRIDLVHMNDVDLADRIAAISAGLDVGTAWVNADAESIAAARANPDLWAEVYHGVGGEPPVISLAVGRVLRWVGLDAGRAFVAHQAELATAAEQGRDPRVSVVRALRLIHGQTDVEG